MEKASGGRFAWVTRKTDEDEDDWDMALNTYGDLSPGSGDPVGSASRRDA
jgi:hypothetical protein